MKTVRALLFLVLLAGEFRPQPASIEAHYTPLMAANRQNILCATNAVLLDDKRMTFIGTALAATMVISLQTVSRSCDLGIPIDHGTPADSKEPPPSQESSVSPTIVMNS